MATSNTRRIPDDDDDAFDERGILKDGRTYRVKMTARDALQRSIAAESAKYWPRDNAPLVTDANGGTSGLHQPGPIYSTDASARDAYWAARDEYIREISTRWRDAATVEGDKPDKPRARAGASTMTMDARERAFQEYDEEIQSAWKYAK